MISYAFLSHCLFFEHGFSKNWAFERALIVPFLDNCRYGFPRDGQSVKTPRKTVIQ